MQSNDNSASLLETVRTAAESRKPLNIIGGNSKAFLGVSGNADQLQLSEHTGIINYEPTELVVTVRAGTPLDELIATLAEHGQMMPFEPPVFKQSTIGGTLATGLSGPRRPYTGSARDYVLGMRVINGQAQDLKFGGEVMKNVAGYDVSRLQVGAFGTLGVLLDMSMKVLPLPECERTVHQTIGQANDASMLLKLASEPWPVSASMINGQSQYIRFSGSEAAVNAAVVKIGGEPVPDDAVMWASVRDLAHDFFGDPRPLWRLSVADHAPMPSLDADYLLDWGGAQRWLKTDEPASRIFAEAASLRGHATRFCTAADGSAVFQPLDGAMQSLQRRVRDSFDANRLFNPGRFHPEIDVETDKAALAASTSSEY